LGTRPGDCFADIVFSFLWARLLQRLEQTLQQAGILDVVPEEWGLQVDDFESIQRPQEKLCKPYLGPTWMDDTCITFSASTVANLELAAGRIGSELLSMCDEFAMSPNLAKGKTELLLIFQGQGASKAKKKHFGPNSPGTFPIVTEAGPRFLNIVSSYAHLGCTLHHRGDLRKEMRRRLGIAPCSVHETSTPPLSEQRTDSDPAEGTLQDFDSQQTALRSRIVDTSGPT